MFSQQPTSANSEISVSYRINYSELQLGKELGRGGFGVVYKGSWRHFDLAVKQLLMDKISSESQKEFERESQTMAGLRSPNIVQFYRVCTSPAYCIVMEYMPNGSLFSVLKSDKPLERTLCLNIALDMSKGVAFLHHESILHRDLKSLNVLLDKTYQTKLTEFGLSKVKMETKSHATAANAFKVSVRTMQWRVPELFDPEEVFTSKSDIYSLGVTLWELSSRKLPFQSTPNPYLIPSLVEKEIREDIPTTCPEVFSTVIQQCWAGEPSQRPDANSVVTLLKNCVITTTTDNINNNVSTPLNNINVKDYYSNVITNYPQTNLPPRLGNKHVLSINYASLYVPFNWLKKKWNKGFEQVRLVLRDNFMGYRTKAYFLKNIQQPLLIIKTLKEGLNKSIFLKEMNELEGKTC